VFKTVPWAEYGKGFNESALTRMIKFAEVFPDETIVATLSRQLSWSHFIEILPLKPREGGYRICDASHRSGEG
jgi:hypothetical protein